MRRVLIADDQPEFRELLKELLAPSGHFDVVGEADDGDEAVRLAPVLNPDLLIMDINMRRMSGLEATLRLRRLHLDMPVVLVSISEEREYATQALRVGASAFVPKLSLTVERLLQVLADQTKLRPGSESGK